MSKPLFGAKIAILAANGFDENDLTIAQRALLTAGATMRIISPEMGLVNGWNGTGWGHHYAIDAHLGSALGADYSMLVIPGGSRSLDKLKLTAHTKRFINSFMAAGKPVAVWNDALHIMIMTDQVRGRTVAGPAEMSDLLIQAGATWDGEEPVQDKNLLSGACADEATRRAMAARMVDFFSTNATMEQAA